MAKFPEPPPQSDLVALGAALVPLSAGALVWRVYFRGGDHPTRWNEFRFFGPTDCRFDHQQPPPRMQSRGVLYAAQSGPTCLAEVYQATRAIDRADRDPWLVGFRVTRDISLLDLTGPWVTKAGASTAIHSGARSRARRWSSAVYEAFPNIEGLAYCASMDANRLAFAFYERAQRALPLAPELHRSLSDPSLTKALDGAAVRFGYVVL